MSSRKLHVLDVAEEVCLARLRKRNATGAHPYVVSDQDFVELTKYFEAPLVSEGFEMIVHCQIAR